jgi:hypothetical protein
MALSYPLTAPASPPPRRLQIKPAAIVGMSMSPFTGEQQIQAHQGAWWEAELDLPPMKRAAAAAWVGMFMALNFREGSFTLPAYPTTPLGVASGTPLVNGNGQSGKSLATKDWGSGVTGIVRAGDLFQLGSGGSAHLYMVAQDANSSIGSTATLEIWPRLRVSPANDDPLTFNNPVGQWRLKEPFDYTIDIAMIFGISVSLVEAF